MVVRGGGEGGGGVHIRMITGDESQQLTSTLNLESRVQVVFGR